MRTSPLDGSRPVVPLTGSMALRPKSTIRGNVSMPEPSAPGVLGATDDQGVPLTPTALSTTFTPAEPPIVLDLAPLPPPGVLGAADEAVADPMEEIAMVEFQVDPGEEAVYVLLHEMYTPDGVVYDVTMAQPAPDQGVLGSSEQGTGPVLRCPVHRVIRERRAPGDQEEQPGVLGGPGELLGGVVGDLVFKRILHVVKAPVNRALRQFIASQETEPTVMVIGPEQTPDAPIESAEAWRSRFDPAREHRVLLFIHGFGSNSEASLPRSWVREFGSRYDAVLAYDHPTISRDPRQNAADLLAQIPDDLRLHVDLLAHSRGGLVSRSLVELHPATSKLNVQHLVTYGSPHAGTLLAHHERWDRLVSISLTAVSWLTSAVAAPAAIIPKLLEYLLRAGGQFIFDLPGIGAMDPGSAFLQELNVAEPHLPPHTRYAAVTSTFDALSVPQLGFREALTALAAQAFMGVPNDLVVPTESMRSIDLPGASQLGDRVFTTNVDHFTYFNIPEVRAFVNNFYLGQVG